MSRPPPQPIFVHHGFIGGVTSCAVVEIDDRTAIVVGTGVGKCEVYDAETHMLLRTVYEDPEKRSISSVGTYDDMLWVHVRNCGVFFIGPNHEVLHSINLNHCGYCRATIIASSLIYPDTSNEKHYLHIVSIVSKDQVKVSLKQLPLSLTSADEVIYVGDETGTVTQVSLQGKIEAEVSLYKEPVFCIASTSTHLACGSSKPPIFLLETADVCGERRKIDYPPSARGVGALAFSSSGKTLVAGFWDGSIRAYSVQKLTILVYLNLHTKAITQLLWRKIGDDELLIAASQDEKLSIWKLK